MVQGDHQIVRKLPLSTVIYTYALMSRWLFV